MKKIVFILIFALTAVTSYGQKNGQKMRESYYQNGFAKIMNGKKEVVLDDQTRVDIVTDTFAIEVDFAEKWAESIGQSMYYAEKTGKKPGILLVVNGLYDDRYIKRLMTVASFFGITVWVMDYNTDNWCEVKLVYSYKFREY